MITNYFNDLRNKGIEVIQEDTCWICCFTTYVLENKILSKDVINRTLNKTIQVLEKGKTTKDVIALLRKFDIDYQPIDELYELSLTEWKEILCLPHDNGD